MIAMSPRRLLQGAGNPIETIRSDREATLLTLGDYIDWGPDRQGVRQLKGGG